MGNPFLKSVIIPSNVTRIGRSAFAGCTSLQTINYTGTQEQWESITLDTNWNFSCNASIVYEYTE